MHAIISADLTNHLVVIFLLSFASFGLSMLLTPVYTFFAYKYKLWKVPHMAGPADEKTPILKELHDAKHVRNIPVMAGMIFIIATTIFTVFFNLERGQTWLLLAAFVGGGLVGFIDDIINVKGEHKRLRPFLKFAMITALGLVCAWFFYEKLGYTSIHIPFPPYDIELGLWMIPLFTFVVVATGNAVNITDAVDGLAGGLAAMAFGFFGAIAIMQGNFGIAGFCFTVVGALISYTWFNILPARFFMTDVGSFSLGTALGVVAMLTNTLFLLPIICFVFVAEAATSLLQIVSKKVFGRKIFLAAPIHQHFLATGWPEAKVTMRFWVIGVAAGVFGLVLALNGGYIT